MTENLPIDEFDTEQELARRLRVSPKTLERKRRDGSGPPYTKAGHRVIYSRRLAAEWIARNTFFSTAAADRKTPIAA